MSSTIATGADHPVGIALNEIERRVLGALMEKSMASPEYYPMTENALVAACNQKQNREPVMELDGDAVWAALESLRERGLVGVVLPGPGARTKRYKHEVDAKFGWHKRERAVMTELLLRGPQTPGELRSRCSRMAPFDDLEAVTLVLDNLAQADPPMVTALPREPGRSAVRYAHQLYPEGELPAGPAPRTPIASTGCAAAENSAGDGAEAARLAAEVARLRDAVEALTARLARVESQISGSN